MLKPILLFCCRRLYLQKLRPPTKHPPELLRRSTTTTTTQKTKIHKRFEDFNGVLLRECRLKENIPVKFIEGADKIGE